MILSSIVLNDYPNVLGFGTLTPQMLSLIGSTGLLSSTLETPSFEMPLEFKLPA